MVDEQNGRPSGLGDLRPGGGALRLDKLQVQALETTLRHLLLEEWDAVPALRMARLSAAEIRARAEALLARWHGVPADIVDGESLLGGGSTPEQTLPTALIRLRGDAIRYEARLRAGDPPVLARIEHDVLLIDLRTVAPEEEEELLGQVGDLPHY